MTTQWHQLAIAYGVTAAGMLVGLLVIGAGARAWWRWPVYSAMVMALGVVLWNLIRGHLVPAQWTLSHPDVLYFGALALYALLGFAIGVLLGRLARRKTSAEDNTKDVTMDLPGPRPPPND